jgi:putative aldouronate transport system substrate-binding protein
MASEIEKGRITVKKIFTLVLATMMCLLFIMTSCSSSPSVTGDQENNNSTPNGNNPDTSKEGSENAQNSDVPEYLNLETDGLTAPIVKGDKIKINVAISKAPTQGEAKQIWLWEYFRQFHNIDAQVEQVPDSAEYRKLAFASGDLPDLILNMGVTNVEIMNYGVNGGLILQADKYIDKYMPNLSAIYAEHPEFREEITAPDGHIYGFGQISDPKDETRGSQYFINCKWLEELGMEMPKTLDEFIDTLRAFKKNYPDSVPFNGGYNANNPCLAILSAYGWITQDPKGLSASLRNGQVVFPYGDREIYGEYLKTMNTLYEEELMSHDFYTIENIAVNANVASGNAGTYTTAPWTANPDVYMDWDTPEPFTSKYNSEKIWPGRQGYVNNSFWIMSSQTKYPELLCKWADFWYNEQGMALAHYGPPIGSKYDTYGLIEGWKWNEKTSWIEYPEVVNDKENKYNGMENPYRQQHIMIGTGVNFGDIRDFFGATAALVGVDYKREWTADSLDFRHYYTVAQHEKPYYIEPYPGNVFFTPEVNQRITDLQSVINAYVETESAKFITGARKLTEEELKNYFDGLDKLGYQEYLKYYFDYYSEYKSK